LLEIVQEFEKRGKWWCSTLYNDGVIWGKGNTRQEAREDMKRTYISSISEETNPRDAIAEWLELNK
jgi:hypothetical protein